MVTTWTNLGCRGWWLDREVKPSSDLPPPPAGIPRLQAKPKGGAPAAAILT